MRVASVQPQTAPLFLLFSSSASVKEDAIMAGSACSFLFTPLFPAVVARMEFLLVPAGWERIWIMGGQKKRWLNLALQLWDSLKKPELACFAT